MGTFDNLSTQYKRANDKKSYIDRFEAKTEGQQLYLDAIKENRVIFAHGPAGSGKTLIASAMSAIALKAKEVERIICVRPAVGSGDPIGFLPGTADEKLMPYLRPIMMELMKFFPANDWQSFRKGECPTVEIQPLEYMRGLTFRNCFVIVDEAQNATHEQMKMIITRLGNGTKMIINGDVSQSDLPAHRQGGFEHYTLLLQDIPEVATVVMDHRDIVRDPLLKVIMERIQQKEAS